MHISVYQWLAYPPAMIWDASFSKLLSQAPFLGMICKKSEKSGSVYTCQGSRAKVWREIRGGATQRGGVTQIFAASKFLLAVQFGQLLISDQHK